MALLKNFLYDKLQTSPILGILYYRTLPNVKIRSFFILLIKELQRFLDHEHLEFFVRTFISRDRNGALCQAHIATGLAVTACKA